MCTLFVCDVVAYGAAKRTDIVQGHIRENLYELLGTSFDQAGIPFSGVYKEDRGDGVLVAVPVEHDPASLVTAAVERLRADLGRYNSLSSEAARIELRVAVHVGIARADAHGLIGTEVNHVFRLLEAPLLKAMVKDGGPTIGLIVSQRFHDEVVLRDTGLISAEDYLQVPVSVKETDCWGWVRIFGGAAPAVLRTTALEPRPETRLAPAEAVAFSVVSGLEPEPEPAFGEAELGPPGLFELVECVLRIPGLLTERGRDQVVEVLPSSIAVVIPRSHDARSDVYQILRTCLDYPEGLQYFMQAVKVFFGGSMAVARLERMVAQVLARL